MLQSLLDDHETIIRELRNDIDQVNDKYHDVGTGDFLTGVMEEQEKMCWMLRAYLS
jgi:starvation-inducible DNA-binding protein